MATQLGYFHFVEGYDNPIGKLQKALAERKGLDAALLTLPEGFNLGQSYIGPSPVTPRVSVPIALSQLSTYHLCILK